MTLTAPCHLVFCYVMHAIFGFLNPSRHYEFMNNIRLAFLVWFFIVYFISVHGLVASVPLPVPAYHPYT